MAVNMVATNKKAHRNYEITETVEAGIVLRGSEVKSLRDAKVQINEAYGRFEQGELWLVGLHISPYVRASTHLVTNPDRKRKLLLHRAELDRLNSKMDQDHLSLVPLSLYFKGNKAKIELGLGRGRKTVDKRQILAKRDADLEARRALARRNRG